MDKKILLAARAITKDFGHLPPLEIIRGIDLEVCAGDTIAIIGASGGGKSTFLHILGALDQPTTGDVTILSEKITASNHARIRSQHIGFMFQSFYLLEDYTVIENALMPARIARCDVSQQTTVYQRMDRLLTQLGLQERKHFYTKLLSGGEKQRLALARALCNDPAILIADEPTGSLDHTTAQELYRTIQEWAQQKQKALIIATHDLELAHRCQKIYRLHNGLLSNA